MIDDVYIDDQNTVTILSIDPGTYNLGYAVFKVDIDSFEIKDAFAWTVAAIKLDTFKDSMIETHGEKMARIVAIKENFKNVLEHYEPLIVVSESPFFNVKRPSAAGPLYELFGVLHQTLYQWDNSKPLYIIDPKTVKKTVGASHNAKKDEVRKCISKIKELSLICIDFLDEHSIDATAVGYTYIVKNIRS